MSNGILFEDEAKPEEVIEPSESLAKKWEVYPGKVYTIQSQRSEFKHRVMCGDSIDRLDLSRLFESRIFTVDAIITDPPYCSGGFQESGKRVGSIGTTEDEFIERDNLSTTGFMELIPMAFGKINAEKLYAFTDWRMWEWIKKACELSGFPAKQMLVWDKGHPGMGTDWRQQTELIYYSTNSPGQMKRSRGNVLSFKRTGNVHHPTEKPVALMRQMMKMGNLKTCYDPFTGSGSTLIACELEKIQFFGMEVSPRHVGSCLERCERLGLSVEAMK